MKDFILNMLVRYGKDRGVWVAVSTFLSHIISRKLGFDIDSAAITDLIVALVTWGATHILHVKVVESKMVADATVKPVETKIDTDFKKD